MKRRLPLLVGAVTVLIALSYGVALQGAWIDQAVSAFVTRQTGVEWSGRHIQIEHWSHFRFDSSRLDFPAQNIRINTGPGGWGTAEPVTVHAAQVSVPRALIKKLPAVFLIQNYSTAPEYVIDKLDLVLTRRSGGLTAHVLNGSSKSVFFDGGAQFQNGQVVKADILVFLSDPAAKRLPEEVLRRLIAGPGGRKGLRVIYGRKQLTLMGSTGVFFKARWE